MQFYFRDCQLHTLQLVDFIADSPHVFMINNIYRNSTLEGTNKGVYFLLLFFFFNIY